jgi:maltose O-acetyltransferase
MDSDHHDPRDHTSAGKSAPVLIEDNVWLGARVTVLRGAHIGEGAVIGAHSVVTGTIPPHTLAAGAPARVIRSLEP